MAKLAVLISVPKMGSIHCAGSGRAVVDVPLEGDSKPTVQGVT